MREQISERRIKRHDTVMRKPILATRVAPVVDRSVRRLTRGLGISISEYLRGLILRDLDSKNALKGELAEHVELRSDDRYSETGKPVKVKHIQTYG